MSSFLSLSAASSRPSRQVSWMMSMSLLCCRSTAALAAATSWLGLIAAAIMQQGSQGVR